MLKIKVTNPYYDEEYMIDAPIEKWNNFLEEKAAGNADILWFKDVTGKIVMVNPSNFASVEGWEE